MDTALLLLADSRLPAGGHAHSGGLEPAVSAGAVRDVAGLAAFLRGRLATSGLVAASLAAAACAHAARDEADGGADGAGWVVLDAEADARTPSPAQRAASRAQGRSLLRAARSTWPHPALAALPGDAHHPVVLGAATAAARGTPRDAASITAYGAVTGPASAAVRLLGLDPLSVHRALADLARAVDAVADEAAAHATGPWRDLPAASAPVLDLYAELHIRADLRLFES
ncbi:urease accessory protein UreF [Actinomadura hibisca]|uniref:urease accessory protein UreF n=1 Tax=Actinomadura hibisca TaxID=68565 RepID=UPI00083319D1|nr:urease accessory UreF family protein [Actinomadura hibisca]